MVYTDWRSTLHNVKFIIRYTLTRFIFWVLDIKVHRARFKVYNVEELKCPLCLSDVDNEVHFVAVHFKT